MRLVRLWGFFFPLISALSGISVLLLLYFGGLAVLHHRLSLGEFTASLSYLTMLIWPLMGAGMVVNLIQRGAASLKRIVEILSVEPEILAPPQALPRPKRFDLSLRKLSFAYSKRRPTFSKTSIWRSRKELSWEFWGGSAVENRRSFSSCPGFGTRRKGRYF